MWLYVLYRKLSCLVKQIKSNGAVRYRRVRHGKFGVSNRGIGHKFILCEEPLSYTARQTPNVTER
jgi:hypothetical protein